MNLFFSVGEASGDQHAARLIQELKRRRPDLQCCGYGGPLMEKAGCDIHYPMTDLAVMGIFRVIPLLWTFRSLIRRANRFFRQSVPDAVILVDYPGFNWWIARKAKAAGIPVFYYLPPQLWAWASWRVERIRKYVDHVLCTLPFESQWYVEQGVDVDYVGHPFFDAVIDQPLDQVFIDTWSSTQHRNIAILPGSRNQELMNNWSIMLEVLKNLHKLHPDARFLVACYTQSHREFCRNLQSGKYEGLPIHYFVEKTSEVIELGECCLMVSGSVSLELLARTTPTVVLYHISWKFYILARFLSDCRYITLPNLIANYEIMPEHISIGKPVADIGRITDVLNRWLSHPQILQRVETDLVELRDDLVQAGATARVAETILRRLDVVRLASHLEAA